MQMKNNREPEKTTRFTFKKEERLCSEKLFEKLFTEGHSFLVFPLKVVFIKTEYSGNYPVKAAFAVSKRSFKKAVHRNRIKRKMREAYRLNKHQLYQSVDGQKMALVFIFIAKEDLNYSVIENAIKKSIKIIPGKWKTSRE